MKTIKTLLMVITLLAAISTTALGYGWYNWYGGYNTATATSWNGGTSVSWNYGPTSWGWGWGSNCYAATYTNTYPGPDVDRDWGWHNAYAHSHSSSGGRTADAQAYAYNASWSWWNSGGYTNAVAQTSGSPSYASATARANSNWWYTYWVPRYWWYNTWTPVHGWYIPYYWRWWYWGWLDGDMSEEDMAMAFDMFAPNDLVWNEDVGGTGHPGWDIIGHDGSQNEEPYDIPFLITAQEVGGNEDYIELLVEFEMGGTLGSETVPEPATIALIGCGLVALAAGTVRRKLR